MSIWNGKLNGEYKEFYEDGQLKMYCNYKNNKLDSRIIFYNKIE